MAEPQRSDALSGVRVLDFTTFLSGPYATQTLGDLGAEIIKVEPKNGEATRLIPPHFVGRDSVYYLSLNRNKKSLALDLKSNEGKEIIYRLVSDCDIVIENFRPGVTSKLGIDYETLKKYKPDIIYCSISGFGQDGPYSQRPAYDMIVQALGGTMSITGEKGGDPVRLGTPLGDIAAGMYAVIGVLSAYVEKERTGKGKFIDVSMLDCQISLLSYLGGYYLHSGQVPGPQGREHDSIPTYRALKAKDGSFVLITANTQKMFEGVCRSIEREDLITDPRFLNGELRLKHKNELVAILQEAFNCFDSTTLLNRLEDNEVPCAPIQNVQAALADPQVVHRKMVISLEHQSGSTIKLLNYPIKFDSFHSDANMSHISPPLLGEHSLTILEELGFSKADTKRLLDSGVIFVT